MVIDSVSTAVRSLGLNLAPGMSLKTSFELGQHEVAIRSVCEVGGRCELPLISLGADRWVLVMATGGHGRATLMVQDASRLGRQLTEARSQLAQNRETLVRYIGALTHDLREPTRCLVSFSEWLEGQIEQGLPNQERAKEVAQRLVSRSERLSEMLEQLRRFVGISMGATQGDTETWPAAEVVSAALSALGSRLETRGVELSLSILSDAQIPAILALAIQNLVDNALKYSEPPAKIAISCHDVGSDVVVIVADKGIGFEPEAAKEIFGFFRQLHPHAERAEGGLGMGLAIVKEIVEQCGGNIRAESDGPGMGASFHFVVPAQAPVSHAPNPAG